MSTGKFVRPSVRVYQELISANPSILEPFFELCIVGPAYQIEEERAVVNQTASYVGKGYLADTPFESVYTGKEQFTSIDVDYTTAKLKNASYKVWPEFGGVSDTLTETVRIANTAAVTTLTYEGTGNDFKHANVQPGDILVVKDNNMYYKAVALSVKDREIRLKKNLYITTVAAPTKQVQLTIVRPISTTSSDILLQSFPGNVDGIVNGLGSDETKVVLPQVLTATIDGSTKRIYSGDVAITYRALKRTLANDFVQIRDQDDIAAYVGKVHQDNPLALAADVALRTAKISFKVLAINEDSQAGYANAMDMLSMAESVYIIVPLTQDEQTLFSFKAHVESMSVPDKGKWRVMYCNAKQPREKLIVEKAFARLKGISLASTIPNATAEFDVNDMASEVPYRGFDTRINARYDLIDIATLKLDDTDSSTVNAHFTLMEDPTHYQVIDIEFNKNNVASTPTAPVWDFQLSSGGIDLTGTNTNGTVTWNGTNYVGFPASFNYTKSTGSLGSGVCSFSVSGMVSTAPGTTGTGATQRLFDNMSIQNFKLDNTVGSVRTVSVTFLEDATHPRTIDMEFTRSNDNEWQYTFYESSTVMPGVGCSGTITYSASTGLYTGFPNLFAYTPTPGSAGTGTVTLDMTGVTQAPGVDDSYMAQGVLAVGSVGIAGLKLSNTPNAVLNTSFILQEDLVVSQIIGISFTTIAPNTWTYAMTRAGVPMTTTGSTGTITYNTSTMSYTGFPATFEYAPSASLAGGTVITLTDEATGLFMTNGVSEGDFVDVIDPLTNEILYALRVSENGVLNENTLVVGAEKYIKKDDQYTVKYPADVLPTSTNIPCKYEVNRKLSPRGVANALAVTAQSFGSKRVRFVQPDLVTIAINNVDYDLPGYYLCVAYGTMRAAFPPHQGFSTIGCEAIKRIYHSNKYFKDDDIDLMSGSGVFMVVQSEPTSIPYCVYQTTTTSTDKLEDKEDSIVATVDFASKFYRDNLRSVLGKFNVNEVSLKYVATVIRDITDRMKRMNYQYIGSILSDGKLLSISSDKDRIIPIISIKVPFPVNYIDLYIQY